MQVVRNHPGAFGKAEFDIMSLKHLPLEECYVCIAEEIVEVVAIAGESEKIRRQVRVKEIDTDDATERRSVGKNTCLGEGFAYRHS